MTSQLQFEEEINKAVEKYAKHVPWQDKEDLKQEARLALFTCGLDLNERLAYDIARKQVIDILRKTPPYADNIDDPHVLRRVENSFVAYPDQCTRLDSEKASRFVGALPERQRFVIINYFGLCCEALTLDDIAEVTHRSKDWVLRQKRLGLKKLYAIMNGER